MQTLKDKVVVITGAACGIGRALALTCGRHGARLSGAADVVVNNAGDTLVSSVEKLQTALPPPSKENP
ncbi:MAG: hypothetical protein KA164_13195 [Rhodoferax sp.]|nr:hypothetical protein [Rhodoferax sp.]